MYVAQACRNLGRASPPPFIALYQRRRNLQSNAQKIRTGEALLRLQNERNSHALARCSNAIKLCRTIDKLCGIERHYLFLSQTPDLGAMACASKTKSEELTSVRKRLANIEFHENIRHVDGNKARNRCFLAHNVEASRKTLFPCGIDFRALIKQFSSVCRQ